LKKSGDPLRQLKLKPGESIRDAGHEDIDRFVSEKK